MRHYISGGVRLLSHQQAERARRRTLEMLVKTASAGTVVVQEAGLGGPGGTVWLGPGNSTQPGELSVTERIPEDEVKEVAKLCRAEASVLFNRVLVLTQGGRGTSTLGIEIRLLRVDWPGHAQRTSSDSPQWLSSYPKGSFCGPTPPTWRWIVRECSPC